MVISKKLKTLRLKNGDEMFGPTIFVHQVGTITEEVDSKSTQRKFLTMNFMFLDKRIAPKTLISWESGIAIGSM
jgi:hypothetical protein